MSVIKRYSGQWIVPDNDWGTDSVTSTLTETKMASILIPANTFIQYDIVGFEARTRKAGTNSTYTMRVRVNTSDTVGGSILGVITSSLSSVNCVDLTRRFCLKTASGTGNGTEVLLNTVTNKSSDIAMTTDGHSNLAIDWTQDQYIMVTIQLGSTSDTGYIRYLYLDFPEGATSVI